MAFQLLPILADGIGKEIGIRPRIDACGFALLQVVQEQFRFRGAGCNGAEARD
jgi:hypothetical protein